MKSTSVTREFLSYVLPTVGAMTASGLYSVVDGIYIGQFVGTDALAATNLAWPLLSILYGLGMMVGIGSGAIASMARGQGVIDRAKASLGNGLLLVFLAGLSGVVVLGYGGQKILELQNITPAIFAHANDYLQVLMFAAPITVGSLALPIMVRNDGAPTLSTWIIVSGAIGNIIFNGIFIAYLDMGLTGAALGTAFSQALVVLMGVAYFFSSWAKTRLTIGNLAADPKLMLKASSIGLSSFLMFIYSGFMTAAHNYMFIQYADASTVGGYAIIGYMLALYCLFATGVASGTQPLISYYFGAGNIQRMKQFVILMLVVTLGVGVLLVMAMNSWPDQFVLAFNNSDPLFFEAAKTGLRLHLVVIFLEGLIFCGTVFFQALGIPRNANIISVAHMVFQLPFLIVLPTFIGVTGVWLAMPMSNICVAIIITWLMSTHWKRLSRDDKNGRHIPCNDEVAFS